MELEKLLGEMDKSPQLLKLLELASGEKTIPLNLDLSRAKNVKVDQETYLEAQSRGISLTELLESEEYDPSPINSPLDAFERQLLVNELRIGGRHPITVEMFYQGAPALLPEFMLREIKAGQKMRPELSRLLASSAQVSSSRYTPFHVNVTPAEKKLSLRPIGDQAEIPTIQIAEQEHTITVPDYGVTLKTSYRALRSRTTAQFKVLLWYIGFRLQADKMGLMVNTIINGDGNGNPATVINTAASGTLAYADLISLWNEFFPFEMNTVLCHEALLRTILTMSEFKDPMAGFQLSKIRGAGLSFGLDIDSLRRCAC